MVRLALHATCFMRTDIQCGKGVCHTHLVHVPPTRTTHTPGSTSATAPCSFAFSPPVPSMCAGSCQDALPHSCASSAASSPPAAAAASAAAAAAAAAASACACTAAVREHTSIPGRQGCICACLQPYSGACVTPSMQLHTHAVSARHLTGYLIQATLDTAPSLTCASLAAASSAVLASLVAWAVARAASAPRLAAAALAQRRTCSTSRTTCKT